jgi:hypothetical protein
MHGQVRLLTSDKYISHYNLVPVQLNPNEIFEISTNSKECRMIQVLLGKKYKVSPRANADIERNLQTCVKGSDMVFSIGGFVERKKTTSSSTVSRYDIANDIW